MKNITLDTSKAAQFLKAGAVEAYEPQVKPLKRPSRMVHVQATISSAGCIYHLQFQQTSSSSSRIALTYCARTAKW